MIIAQAYNTNTAQTEAPAQSQSSWQILSSVLTYDSGKGRYVILAKTASEASDAIVGALGAAEKEGQNAIDKILLTIKDALGYGADISKQATGKNILERGLQGASIILSNNKYSQYLSLNGIRAFAPLAPATQTAASPDISQNTQGVNQQKIIDKPPSSQQPQTTGQGTTSQEQNQPLASSPLSLQIESMDQQEIIQNLSEGKITSYADFLKACKKLEVLCDVAAGPENNLLSAQDAYDAANAILNHLVNPVLNKISDFSIKEELFADAPNTEKDNRFLRIRQIFSSACRIAQKGQGNMVSLDGNAKPASSAILDKLLEIKNSVVLRYGIGSLYEDVRDALAYVGIEALSPYSSYSAAISKSKGNLNVSFSDLATTDLQKATVEVPKNSQSIRALLELVSDSVLQRDPKIERELCINLGYLLYGTNLSDQIFAADLFMRLKLNDPNNIKYLTDVLTERINSNFEPKGVAAAFLVLKYGKSFQKSNIEVPATFSSSFDFHLGLLMFSSGCWKLYGFEKNETAYTNKAFEYSSEQMKDYAKRRGRNFKEEKSQLIPADNSSVSEFKYLEKMFVKPLENNQRLLKELKDLYYGLK